MINKVAYLAGSLDIGASKRQIAVISKTDMPDADVAATRQLLRGIGFQEPIFELNSHDPRSVQHLVDYLTELSQRRKGQVKKLITANDIRAAHARGEQEMSVVLRAASSPRRRAKLRSCWASPSVNAMNPRQPLLLSHRLRWMMAKRKASAFAKPSLRSYRKGVYRKPGRPTDGQSHEGETVAGAGRNAAEL